MKRLFAAPALVLASAFVMGLASPALAQSAGSIDNVIRSLDNVARGVDGAVDDVIEGAGDAARAGKRVGDDAAGVAGDAVRAAPVRRLPGVADDLGEGAADAARQGLGGANPPPLRNLDAAGGIARQGGGAVDNAPAGVLRQATGAADAAPMATDDLFEGFVRGAGDGADAPPLAAYDKMPGPPAAMVDDAAGAAPAGAPVYTAAPQKPAGAAGDVAAAPRYDVAPPIYDDFSNIGKLKPAKPPLKPPIKNVAKVGEAAIQVADVGFIVAPKVAVKAVKRTSKLKKALIGGAVVATTGILGGTGYVLYETVSPVKEGIDTAYAKTQQGFGVAGEKLKAVFQPGDPATFIVQNKAGDLVEIYKTTAGGDELLSTISEDGLKVVLNVAIGDKLAIHKGGALWNTYEMTSETNGIEIVVE